MAPSVSAQAPGGSLKMKSERPSDGGSRSFATEGRTAEVMTWSPEI